MDNLVFIVLALGIILYALDFIIAYAEKTIKGETQKSDTDKVLQHIFEELRRATKINEKEHDFDLKKEEVEYYSDMFMFKEEKQDHLRSLYWKNLKQRRLKKANDLCEYCKKARPLELHHITYKRLGAEKLGDVRVLCRSCHSLLHQNADKIYKSGYSRQNEYPLNLLKED